MRVTCHTHEEFLAALSAESAVLQNVVRASTHKKPLDGVNGGWKNATKIEIILQLSTVVLIAEEHGGGQYVLEVGFICGMDYVGEGDLKGSEAAESVLRLVTNLCDERGWRVLPGVIHI